MAGYGNMNDSKVKRKKKVKPTERIHGKVKKIGTGLGERTGKKAKFSIRELRRRQSKLLESLD